jgi:ABC-2 type transport system permease protein
VEARYITARRTARERLAYDARIIGMLSRSEFKLKYAGSLLGYVWSLVKPLAYFTVLWVVFHSIFKSSIDHFTLYLLIGIVLNTFLIDAVSATLPSIVSKGATIRRVSFPPLVIPLATSVAAAMTFLVNCVVVAVFLAVAGMQPEWAWLLLVPLLLELYVFVAAIAVIASTLYVRFRDVAQLWEVGAALLFFIAPIMYPITILPTWAQRLAELNPFVQVLQDVRLVLLGPATAAADGVTAPLDGRLLPLAIVCALVGAAVLLYRRESPRFAERA